MAPPFLNEWTIDAVEDQVKQFTRANWIDSFIGRYLEFSKVTDSPR